MEYMLSTEDVVMPSHELKRLLRRAVVRAMQRRNMDTDTVQSKLSGISEIATLEELLVHVLEGRDPKHLL